ncbi:tetratricopeptide repeat protein, partial [Vibrio cholerae]|nr:tetratricopeptide repeat protein [Vibrio cholerae]
MVVNIMKGKYILVVFTLVLLACQPVVCKEKNELDDTVLNAQRYLVENNIKAALSILENAILKYPKNNVLRLQFAIALYKNKSYEDSLNQLFKLKSMEEDSQVLEKIDMYIDRI